MATETEETTPNQSEELIKVRTLLIIALITATLGFLLFKSEHKIPSLIGIILLFLSIPTIIFIMYKTSTGEKTLDY